MIGKLCFDCFFREELSRSYQKKNSHYTTMVDWIEKEVEASIMEIDPCILICCNVFALSSTFSNLELWIAFI